MANRKKINSLGTKLRKSQWNWNNPTVNIFKNQALFITLNTLTYIVYELFSLEKTSPSNWERVKTKIGEPFPNLKYSNLKDYYFSLLQVPKCLSLWYELVSDRCWCEMQPELHNRFEKITLSDLRSYQRLQTASAFLEYAPNSPPVKQVKKFKFRCWGQQKANISCNTQITTWHNTYLFNHKK